MTRYIEKAVLKIMVGILPPTVYDRIVIWWRRKINKVTGYYPEAFYFSKKKDKNKYCVVRYSIPTYALMAAGIQYIFCYYKLCDKGYIPVLDLECEYSYEQGRIGELGIWDSCFEQSITAKDAIKQKYVLATGNMYDYSGDKRIAKWLNGDTQDHFLHVKKDNYKEYYAKAKKLTEPIWKVKDTIIAELEKEVGSIIKEQRVLGVFLREDFSNDVIYKDKKDIKVYENHPLLPTVQEIINIIKNDLQQWQYDKIYVSALYSKSIETMKKELGDKVVYIQRKNMLSSRDDRKIGFTDTSFELYEKMNKTKEWYYENNISYVKDLVALSRCTYFLGGPCSGSAVALTMNGGKYEDIYILEDKRKITRY